MRKSREISFVAHVLTAVCMAFTLTAGKAQARDVDEGESARLRVESAFVWVPALVKGDKGQPGSSDITGIRLSDNGVAEKVTPIDTKKLPISLVILMQTGGEASRFLLNYGNLPWLVQRLTRDSVHEITLATFDRHVEQIWHFPVHADALNHALTHQHSGDEGAAIRDAVAFGVRQLESEPGRFRRIVLLLSQQRDIGSSISSRSFLEQLGNSSTVVYALTFSGDNTRSGLMRDHTAAAEKELNETIRALENQTAKEIASLTGGTTHQFHDQPEFNSAMLETISDFSNGITLGFQPSSHQAGFHRLKVGVDSPKLRVVSNRSYWWMRQE